MQLSEYAAVLRRRWPVVVVPAVLGLLATAVAASLAPNPYSSTTSLYLAPRGTASDSLLAQQLSTYAAVAGSPVLEDAVARDAGLAGGAAAAADQLSVAVEPDTLLLSVTASGSSPEQATALASSAARQLVVLVDRWEPTAADRPAALVVAQPATVGRTPTLGASAGDALLGALLGVLLGAVAALLIEASAPHPRWVRVADRVRRAELRTLRRAVGRLGLPVSPGDRGRPAGRTAAPSRVRFPVQWRGWRARPAEVVLRVPHTSAVAQAPPVTGPAPPSGGPGHELVLDLTEPPGPQGPPRPAPEGPAVPGSPDPAPASRRTD